jgi:hypothetical protein
MVTRKPSSRSTRSPKSSATNSLRLNAPEKPSVKSALSRRPFTPGGGGGRHCFDVFGQGGRLALARQLHGAPDPAHGRLYGFAIGRALVLGELVRVSHRRTPPTYRRRHESGFRQARQIAGDRFRARRKRGDAARAFSSALKGGRPGPRFAAAGGVGPPGGGGNGIMPGGG